MRIKIQFTAHKPLILPIEYNHIVQGFIYAHLEPVLRKQIHEKGYLYENRQFRLFTFSRIEGKYRIEGKNFILSPPFSFIIASPITEILQDVAENLMKGMEARFGSETAYLEAITVESAPDFGIDARIKMLSPMTVYSTLQKGDGTKKTYYYAPQEEDFSLLIKENLRKKYALVHQKELPSDFDFVIEPLNVTPRNQKVIMYKGTVIKGWTGIYRLRGEADVIKLSYDTGLGSKNSQGFGVWEALK